MFNNNNYQKKFYKKFLPPPFFNWNVKHCQLIIHGILLSSEILCNFLRNSNVLIVCQISD